MALAESNKAKIAKRVIEVLEFFDEEHPQATVMDIVRRFDRPQSSTSELLSTLVDLGVLYKDPSSRSYSPTPRAALLGTGVQPTIVRDGQLTGIVDRLSAQTGLGVAVFGMVGLKAQVYNWRSGKRALRTSRPAGLCGGQQEHLSDTAAGWLLLSTVATSRRDGMLRRLNAEAGAERKFCFGEMVARVQQCRDRGYAIGSAGFGSQAEIAGMLLPGLPEGQPLAIGFVYEPSEQIDRRKLLQCLTAALARCMGDETPGPASVQPLFDGWNTKREMKHG
jgi:DNA-binding IclR family transcriptional regulator